MATIRILMQEILQQLGIHFIEEEKQKQPMERSREDQHYKNERRDDPEQYEAENKNENEIQWKRQIHLLRNSNQNYNENLILQDIQPFASTMELEESNKPTLNKKFFTNLNSTSKNMRPSSLQVLLQSPLSTSTIKQILYDKIIIFGFVWHKNISGLFDYEEMDKNSKSSIVIEDDVRSHINFVTGKERFLPNEEDVFLAMFKTKMNKIIYQKIFLRDVEIAYFKRYLPQSKKVDENDQHYSAKEFLCALKLVVNSLTNQFTIKVFSFDELINHVKLAKRKSLNETNREQSKEESWRYLYEPENSQSKEHQQQKNEFTKQENNQSLSPLLQLNTQPQTHQPFFIIRTLSKNFKQQSQGYKLYPGDLIKLGKIQYKVIYINGESFEDRSKYYQEVIDVTQIAEERSQEIECKICRMGKSEKENDFFVVGLCNCKGSAGYVHYNCMTTWLMRRPPIETATQNVKMYNSEKKKCQLCTKQFPKYFRYNEKLYSILPIDLPKKHLMLDNVSQQKGTTTVVITGVEGNQTIIGRGKNVQMRVSDITVSREHASITRIGEDFYIKDMNSKFGTVVRSSQREIETEIDHKKGFQISNVIFTVQVIKKEVQREILTEKKSEKEVNSEIIKQQKQQYDEENDQTKNKNTLNNSCLRTVFLTNRGQDNHPNLCFDQQKLYPHISPREKITFEIINQTQPIKQQITSLIKQETKIVLKKQELESTTKKLVIYEEEKSEPNEEEEEKTRTSKRPETKSFEERIQKQQSIKRIIQKRLSEREKLNYFQQKFDEIELEYNQNTRNTNNNARSIPSLISSKSIMKRTQSQKISFEEDQENQSSSN